MMEFFLFLRVVLCAQASPIRYTTRKKCTIALMLPLLLCTHFYIYLLLADPIGKSASLSFSLKLVLLPSGINTMHSVQHRYDAILDVCTAAVSFWLFPFLDPVLFSLFPLIIRHWLTIFPPNCTNTALIAEAPR